MRGTEKEKMLGMVDDFIDHLEDTDNESLLARIYGIYTIKSDCFASVDVLVMQNTALSKNSKNCLTFDLKGNTRNRKVRISSKDRTSLKEGKGCSIVLRDLNFIDIKNKYRDLV